MSAVQERYPSDSFYAEEIGEVAPWTPRSLVASGSWIRLTAPSTTPTASRSFCISIALVAAGRPVVASSTTLRATRRLSARSTGRPFATESRSGVRGQGVALGCRGDAGDRWARHGSEAPSLSIRPSIDGSAALTSGVRGLAAGSTSNAQGRRLSAGTLPRPGSSRKGPGHGHEPGGRALVRPGLPGPEWSCLALPANNTRRSWRC